MSHAFSHHNRPPKTPLTKLPPRHLPAYLFHQRGSWQRSTDHVHCCSTNSNNRSCHSINSSGPLLVGPKNQPATKSGKKSICTKKVKFTQRGRRNDQPYPPKQQNIIISYQEFKIPNGMNKTLPVRLSISTLLPQLTKVAVRIHRNGNGRERTREVGIGSEQMENERVLSSSDEGGVARSREYICVAFLSTSSI